MELTKKERLILINQYAILEKVDPANSRDHALKRTALEEGYTLQYGQIFSGIDEEMSIEDCKEVLSILEMYRAITFSYFKINNVKTIDEDKYLFKGFDGNNETEQFSYCSYFISELGRYQELTYGNEFYDFNSHMPMLDKYRRMLAVWESYGDTMAKMNLNQEQIEQLLEA